MKWAVVRKRATRGLSARLPARLVRSPLGGHARRQFRFEPCEYAFTVPLGEGASPPFPPERAPGIGIARQAQNGLGHGIGVPPIGKQHRSFGSHSLDRIYQGLPKACSKTPLHPRACYNTRSPGAASQGVC